MNKRITKAITLLLTLLMLFSLVGCNNAASDSDGGNDNSARDTSKVTIAFSSEPISMSVWDNEEMAPIYSAYLTNSFLMKIDPETLEPVCDLAESYEIVSDTE